MSYKRFIADLHIHSCLSPCAELDMTPKRIIDTAVKKGLNIIAIADHNSAENIETALTVAQHSGITVLPAMEITSFEEAHVLAVFDSVEKALKMQKIVYENLPDGLLYGKNDFRKWGYQLVVNEKDEITEFNRMVLFSAVRLSLNEIMGKIHDIGGLAIASHIDREVFSVISQLGFIPEDIRFDALEFSYNTKREQAEAMFGDYMTTPWITASDAHHLEHIGRRTTSFFLEEPSFEEIAIAFKGYRKIEW